jgi:hypothetical protein
MLHLASRHFKNYRTLPTVPNHELNAVWEQEILLHIGLAFLFIGLTFWGFWIYLG